MHSSGDPQPGCDGRDYFPGQERATAPQRTRNAEQLPTTGYEGQRRSPSQQTCEGSRRIVALSRRLTRLLRHQAVQKGLSISPDGYVKVADLLALRENRGQFTVDDVIHVVQTDEKQRFSLVWRSPNTDMAQDVSLRKVNSCDENRSVCAGGGVNDLDGMPSCLRNCLSTAGPARRPCLANPLFQETASATLQPESGYILYIRANQGHSLLCVDSEKLLRSVRSFADLPARCFRNSGVFTDITVVHGTYHRSWEKIRTEGLSRMSRNHIHFASGLPGDDGVISGMRSTADILIFLNVQMALDEGLKLFVSSNDVILSPGNSRGVIETRFFKKVVNRLTEEIIFQS